MKSKEVYNSWQRNYRTHYVNRNGEVSFQLVVEESDIQVVAQKNLVNPMLSLLRELRTHIKSWQILHGNFQTALMPLPVPEQAPEVVRRMYQGAMQAGVGPFATVAGTIAQMLAEGFADISPDLIVENGGDIYLYSQSPRVVALLADPKGGASLGLQLEVQDFPLALCASSATIGHSLSLGCGDLAVVRSRDGSLADAVATALGNRLKDAASVELAIEFAQSIDGVDGVFVQCNDAIGVWGNMVLTQV